MSNRGWWDGRQRREPPEQPVLADVNELAQRPRQVGRQPIGDSGSQPAYAAHVVVGLLVWHADGPLLLVS
jgi:hypothetical protein